MEHIDDKEIIRKLQKSREKKGISYNMLVEMTKEIGEPVAYSTISKVFGKDGENTSFNYIGTLQPLAKILLDGEEDDAEVVSLQAELKVKEETIEKLNLRIETLIKQMDFMMHQIELKDKRMDTKDELIQRVMDRNDKKDQSIKELMEENKKLEEDLRELMNRCKLCDKKIK